jgi:GTP-binding protein
MPQPARASWDRGIGDLDRLPADWGAEVAFVGRSNSGKSSAINAITGRKRLAFVSRTPGRTQSINFFGWGPNRRLVDLPGYGYAAVPARQTRLWAMLISPYLQARASLRGLVLVMDARHLFTEPDSLLLEWAAPLKRPLLVLLTKSDKLGRQQALRALELGRATLASAYPTGSIQLFSATSGLGVASARAAIIQWLELGKKIPRLKGSKTGGKCLNKD